ncbi:hypothetical protein, partial [Hyphococcus sp.]
GLDTIEAQDTKFKQLNFGVDTVYVKRFGDDTEIEFGGQYSQFDNTETTIELEVDPDDLAVLPTEADLLNDLSISGFGPEPTEIEIFDTLD